MRLLLTLVAVAVTAITATADEPKKDDKMKKHELKVSFATPNPSWKATISEARVVGKEIWVKVDVASAGGIAPQVIGKAEAAATVEAPDLPVRQDVGLEERGEGPHLRRRPEQGRQGEVGEGVEGRQGGVRGEEEVNPTCGLKARAPSAQGIALGTLIDPGRCPGLRERGPSARMMCRTLPPHTLSSSMDTFRSPQAPSCSSR